MRQEVVTDEAADFRRAATDFEAFLANPGHFPDPYPLFQRVRRVEPLHWSNVGTWVVLGHPEAREVFRHPGLSRRESAASFVARFDPRTQAARQALDTYLAEFVHMDEPQHARVRALVAHAFTPKAVRQWEAVIVEIVDELIDALEGRAAFDLLHDFAYPIPSRVICDMVGVPRPDHAMFEEWTTAWLNTNFTDPRADVSKAVEPLEMFVAYLQQLVAERRRQPGDHDDLVSVLLNAEESGDRLSEQELIASLMLLIIGGHETTANLISNGTLALLRNPDQFGRLRNNPSLITSAVEEFLRYESPARSQPRLAVEDVPVGDRVIRKGEAVQVHAGAVNRDERVFENPDTLDIGRVNNNHLAFGTGAHFCIGVHVARLEARHAIGAVAERMGNLELAGDVHWRNGHVRALTSLPVRQS